MATLTYDPTEVQEGELNSEEQEALKVGEQLAEQQDQLLAGKFKDAEELEKGYIELQKKLGDSSEEKVETPEATDENEEKTEDDTEETSDFLERLWKESQKENYSEEILKELEEIDAKDLAQLYLDEKYKNRDAEPEQTELTDEQVSNLHNVVGGEKEYDSMLKWAAQNLDEAEIGMYDDVMSLGNPLAAFFAVKALSYRYNDVSGYDGQMVTGKAPSNSKDVFRSQAEVVRAMNDPKYENDPAYRKDIYDKLERSDIQF